MSYSFDVALSFAMENIDLVETVYHYLKAEGLSVFYAPAPECQTFLSGENQRESFYRIFGLEARYVVLFVSKDYIVKTVPMEEAKIAFSKHTRNRTIIPVYIDGTNLPKEMLNPSETNYFTSNDAAIIACHVAEKIENGSKKKKTQKASSTSRMEIKGNMAVAQVFIQHYDGEGINEKS